MGVLFILLRDGPQLISSALAEFPQVASIKLWIRCPLVSKLFGLIRDKELDTKMTSVLCYSIDSTELTTKSLWANRA